MDDVFGLFLMLAFAGVFLAFSAFWLWMLITALMKEPSGPDKIVWVFVIVLLPFIGSLIYFFGRYLGRKRSTDTV
jgi:hypothetical protein